jgi:hypothetical protein
MGIVVGRRRRRIKMEGQGEGLTCVYVWSCSIDRLSLFIKRGVQARISGRFCACFVGARDSVLAKLCSGVYTFL